jgi:hypothetical protein
MNTCCTCGTALKPMYNHATLREEKWCDTCSQFRRSDETGAIVLPVHCNKDPIVPTNLTTSQPITEITKQKEKNDEQASSMAYTPSAR